MDKAVLEHWIAEGESLEAIGRRVGRHPSTVAYWLRKHGLAAPHRDRHAARGGLDRELLAEFVAQDLTVQEIAGEVGRSAATVRHWLQRHGLKTSRAARMARPVADRADGVCRRHGETEFVRREGGSSRCARCRSEAVSRRRRAVKRMIVEEAGGACVICGYDRHIGALHFHHVDPANKRFHLGLKGLARGVDEVREEARKCVLLCANCHAEVEGGAASVPASAVCLDRG